MTNQPPKHKFQKSVFLWETISGNFNLWMKFLDIFETWNICVHLLITFKWICSKVSKIERPQYPIWNITATSNSNELLQNPPKTILGTRNLNISLPRPKNRTSAFTRKPVMDVISSQEEHLIFSMYWAHRSPHTPRSINFPWKKRTLPWSQRFS